MTSEAKTHVKPNKTSYDDLILAHPDNILGKKSHISLKDEEKLSLYLIQVRRSQPVQFTRIHCTSCDLHLGSSMTTVPNIFVHPLFKVIVCRKCFFAYRGEKFKVEEDGSECMCRWCARAGESVCCNRCSSVICKSCLRRNLNEEQVSSILKEEIWNCFYCDSTPIVPKKLQTYELRNYFLNEIAIAGNSKSTVSRTDYSKCCYNEFHRKYSEFVISQTSEIKVKKEPMHTERSIELVREPKKDRTVAATNKRRPSEEGRHLPKKKFLIQNSVFALFKDEGNQSTQFTEQSLRVKILEMTTKSALANSTLASTILGISSRGKMIQTCQEANKAFALLDETLYQAIDSLIEISSMIAPNQDKNESNQQNPCVNCGKTFRWKTHLLTHRKWECGKFPKYKCALCSRAFHQSSNWKIHMAGVHSISL